jgi:hypothetical protein
MFFEMPVLERATPAAAVIFLPLTIAYAEASSVVDFMADLVSRLPRGLGNYYDVVVELLSRDPISIRDDGVGGADPARGSGLIGLTDCVDAVGGTLTVLSPVGGGTTMQIELPMAPSNPRPSTPLGAARDRRGVAGSR